MMFDTSAGDVMTVSADLAIAAHLRVGVEVGADLRDAAGVARRQHQDRHRFAVRLRDAAVGVLRARAVCMQKAPMLAPEVTREIASAMCRPMRSWRTMIGRMSAAAASSIRWLTGYAQRISMPSRFMISAIASPTFILSLL